MSRTIAGTLACALTLALLGAPGGAARGQYGRYGGGIGAGSTPQGDILRGEGIFATGAGLYNYYTAMGNSINADTMMRVNEYIYQSLKADNAEKARHRAAKAARNLNNYNRNLDRIKNDPNMSDLARGEALNAVYEQLASPKYPPSSYRGSSFPLDTAVVKKIPFVYGPGNDTIAMARIAPPDEWPIALRGPECARARENYKHALDAVLFLQYQGKTTRESLAALRAAVEDLSRTLKAVQPEAKETLYLEARNFVTELEKSYEMMKKKEVESIVGELDRYAGTTVHDLVVFMQKHHLRFGISRVGEERGAYPKLYAALREQLDVLEVATSDPGREPGDRGR